MNVEQQVPRVKEREIAGFEWARATHIADALEPMEARWKLAADFPGATAEPIGVKEIDDVVAFGPGRLSVIAGRQGAGKSALALQAARFVAGRRPVLYILTEMNLEEVVTRTVANAAHIDAWKLERGAHPEVLAAARNAMLWLRENADISFVETNGAPAKQVFNGMKTWLAANPDAGLVVCDNLWGLAMSEGANDTGALSFKLGRITRALANLSVSSQVPLILVHHLNRSGAPSREEAIPDASQLGGSDHIGNWAHHVLILKSRQQPKNDFPNGTTVGDPTHDLFVVKNRSGRSDVKVGLRFVGAQMRFEGTTEATPFNRPDPSDARATEYREALAALPEW
jgi:replicative DNA helicase